MSKEQDSKKDNTNSEDDLVSHVLEESQTSGDEKEPTVTQDMGAESSLTKELETAKNDLLYLKAEFDNYKKRVIKERSELVKYGSEHAFSQILEIVDNFERALSIEITPENLKSFEEGMRMVYSSLIETLKRLGVEEVESEGKPFDPNFHEALSAEETNDVPEGHVLRILKKPYKLHDKIIRPGQVIVAKETESKE